MATAPDRTGKWETQAELDACLAECGVTKDQVVRWRRLGLLPKDVEQDSDYHGSVVRFPVGTCAQIKAASALFEKKNRVDYVGLRLWRQGFPVDEKHWRPVLMRRARMLDRVIPFVMRLVQRFDRNWREETFYDYAARRLEPINGVALSRIKKRIDAERMPTVLRVIGDVGTGGFDGFESSIAGEEDTGDEALTIRALDLAKAGSDAILGKKLNLIELLPSGLRNVSAALSMGNFERAANAPTEEIARAREDAKNSLAIGFYLYETNRWIYGDGAFGLRLLAWIVRKDPDALVELMTLLMFRLRQVPDAILPSDKILEMAWQARDVCVASRKLEWLWRNDRRFSAVLNPKRIKSAFADQNALKRWQSELKAITVQGAAKPLIGFNHES